MNETLRRLTFSNDFSTLTKMKMKTDDEDDDIFRYFQNILIARILISISKYTEDHTDVFSKELERPLLPRELDDCILIFYLFNIKFEISDFLIQKVKELSYLKKDTNCEYFFYCTRLIYLFVAQEQNICI